MSVTYEESTHGPVITDPVAALRRLARELYHENGGDLDASMDHVAEVIEMHEDYRRAAVKFAARELVHEVKRNARNHVADPVEDDAEPIKSNGDGGRKENPRQIAAEFDLAPLHGLLAYTMSTGELLGNSTRQDVANEAEMHRKFAAGNMSKALWFSAIERKMKRVAADTKVMDVLTADQVFELREKAHKKSSEVTS